MDRNSECMILPIRAALPARSSPRIMSIDASVAAQHTGMPVWVEVMHPPGSMTSTHTGNPVCCAATLASIDIILGEDLAGNASRMGKIMHSELRSIQQD